MHRGDPYHATLVAYRYGNDQRELTLRLAHGGFRSAGRRCEGQRLPHQQRAVAAELPPGTLGQMPALNELRTGLECNQLTIAYHRGLRRFDLGLARGPSQRVLRLCFEPGGPVGDMTPEMLI